MISELREKCAERGFVLCHPIHTKWYNDIIVEEGLVKSGALVKLPQPPGNFVPLATNCNDDTRICSDRDEEFLSKPQEVPERQCLYNAVLIGNTNSIWKKFISWLASKYRTAIATAETSGNDNNEDDRMNRNIEILNHLLYDNPFDTFITESLSDVFQSCFHPYHSSSSTIFKSYEVFWSHGLRYKVDLQPSRSVSDNDDSTTRRSIQEEETIASSLPTSSSSFLVSMQRLAKITGEYWHDDEGTKLCVHPTYGTWHAFRALVVFFTEDGIESNIPYTSTSSTNVPQFQIPSPSPILNCPCPVNQDEIEKAKLAMKYAPQMMSGGRNNDDDDGDHNHDDKDNKKESINTYEYGRVCVVSKGKDSTNQELCQYLHNSTSSGSDWSKVTPSLRSWIRLRDCISVGRDEYKYCDNQLLYHYTKDVEILKNELREILRVGHDALDLEFENDEH